jgi:hypothetical protein
MEPTAKKLKVGIDFQQAVTLVLGSKLDIYAKPTYSRSKF